MANVDGGLARNLVAGEDSASFEPNARRGVREIHGRRRGLRQRLDLR